MTPSFPHPRYVAFGLCAGAVAVALSGALALQAQQVPDTIMKAEAQRVAVVEKVKPSVVAVFGAGGKGGGSGVLVSDDGYALTNYHVVAGSGPVMQCGLPDGVLYDGVLVGLDKVGDVALIKLLGKKDGQKFPYAPMGDSDKCREGDWSLAMGNPFLLATDFTPTVTYGLISGVHRYQYPSGTFLEYTDCIQIDTSINPGNSGGPLFNMQGELIGINGRGSFDKRPRINSGVGYAISINQIKNFMGHLRAGLDTDHATLGAAVTTQNDKAGLGRLEVTQILDDSDVHRRGLEYGDEVLSFDGRAIFSVNHFKNVLGLFPRGWRVPMEFRHPEGRQPEGEEAGIRKEILVRLMGVQRKLLDDEKQPKDGPQPKGGPQPKAPNPNSPAAKYYQPKEGFANFYFNKEERDKLMDKVKAYADCSAVAGKWEIQGDIKFSKANTATPFKLEIAEEPSKAGEGVTQVVRFKLSEAILPIELFPTKPGQNSRDLKAPEESGGFLAAMYVLRNLLTKGASAFEGQFAHGGHEPYYPPTNDRKKSAKDRRRDAEVINAVGGPFITKFFFDLNDPQRKLGAFEVRLLEGEDPCEVYLSDYRQVDGRWLPHRIQVVYGDSNFGTLDLTSIKLNAPSK